MSQNNPIIILGSSNSNGKTRKAVDKILGGASIPIVDLKLLNIAPFDYEMRNQDDDSMPLMERITKHDLIVLATPVYWYTMSGHMKIFLDRITDLLKIRKDLGRQWRGKKLFVIASFGTSLPRGFEDAFSQTCEYMDMIYQGCSFIYSRDDPELLMGNEEAILKARRSLGL